jgi:hypothetical protein
VQLGQGRHRVDHVRRKQSDHARHDPRKLRVALREVLRAVQLVEEKRDHRAVAFGAGQIGIGEREPALLERFDRADPSPQRGVGTAPFALVLDDAQPRQDPLGGRRRHGVPADHGRSRRALTTASIRPC